MILNRGTENAFILIGREARLYGYKRHREERDLVEEMRSFLSGYSLFLQ